MAILIIVFEITILCEIICIAKWKKSIEKREKAMQKAEAILANIVAAQYEQIQIAQHLLNTQKHKNHLHNQLTKEIIETMEEVKEIASNFGDTQK